MFMALRVTWNTCYSWLQKSDLQLARVQVNYSHILSLLFSFLDNFLFDPILHHAYSSWMKKKNDRNNRLPLGLRFYFGVVWGYTDISPSSMF